MHSKFVTALLPAAALVLGTARAVPQASGELPPQPTVGAGFFGQQAVTDLLRRELQNGQAIVWYLGHAGWAIKTRTRLLIFDYWQMEPPPAKPSLAHGYVNPDELSGVPVTVFVTHSHGDHYDPVILQWEESIPDIGYVFGWKASDDPDHICLIDERARQNVDGMEIATINHSFDNIPEVALLVRLDGLVIYHSGDHGSVGDELNPVFKENIDYLAHQTDRTDMAFLSIFGRRGGGIVNNGDLYTVEQMQPSVAFPMHRGRDPQTYSEWARAMTDSGTTSTVRFASSRGEWFFYSSGAVTRGEPGTGKRER